MSKLVDPGFEEVLIGSTSLDIRELDHDLLKDGSYVASLLLQLFYQEGLRSYWNALARNDRSFVIGLWEAMFLMDRKKGVQDFVLIDGDKASIINNSGWRVVGASKCSLFGDPGVKWHVTIE
jgi:hypothetical protein